MALTAEQKTMIMQRALPLLLAGETRTRKAAALVKQDALQAALTEQDAALQAYNADASNTDRRDAAKAAHTKTANAKAEAQHAGQRVHDMGQPQAAFEMLLTNLDALTTGDLEAWCEQCERDQLDEAIAEQQATLTKTQALRTALG